MWNPNLKSKYDEIHFVGSNLLLIALSIFLLFGNGINIKNKAIAVIRIALNCAGIALTTKVLKDTSIWLLEDYSSLERSKRKARKLISEEQIIIDTDDSINAIHGLIEELEQSQNKTELIPFDWQSLRNARQYPHISIEEKTGGGKSTLAEYLGSLLGGRFVAIAPHYKPGDFQSADLIVGRGRNYGDQAEVLQGNLLELHQDFESVLSGENPVNVLQFLELTHAEMRYRYTLNDYENTEKLNIVLDEFNSYGNKKGVKDLFKELIREARKVNIRLIILCQGSEVKALGIEGEGSLRENLTRIRLKNFAIKEAKVQLNKCKEGSENQQYWQAILNGLNNNNWAALIDDNFAIIPNLSNWNNNNTEQIILEPNTIDVGVATFTTESPKTLYNRGYPDCNHCGSDNVRKHSNNRILCKDCGKTSTIKAKKK